MSDRGYLAGREADSVPTVTLKSSETDWRAKVARAWASVFSLGITSSQSSPSTGRRTAASLPVRTVIFEYARIAIAQSTMAKPATSTALA